VKSELIGCFALKITPEFSDWSLEEESIDSCTCWWWLW